MDGAWTPDRGGGIRMKKILLLLVVLVFAATAAYAEDGAEKELSLWEVIRAKIEKVTPQKKPAVTTAVGGVRGARSEAASDLYWKGEETGSAVSEQELDKFAAALHEAEGGNLVQARKLFEEFVTEYPESELSGDALLALKEMSVMPAPVSGESPPLPQ